MSRFPAVLALALVACDPVIPVEGFQTVIDETAATPDGAVAAELPGGIGGEIASDGMHGGEVSTCACEMIPVGLERLGAFCLIPYCVPENCADIPIDCMKLPTAP